MPAAPLHRCAEADGMCACSRAITRKLFDASADVSISLTKPVAAVSGRRRNSPSCEKALAGGVPVVMAGDGVDDAAALAAATVGIAVHGGAEASLAAADVYLNRAGLQPIVDLLGASRRTMRVIHRNLASRWATTSSPPRWRSPASSTRLWLHCRCLPVR